jgi:hypothetical protein
MSKNDVFAAKMKFEGQTSVSRTPRSASPVRQGLSFKFHFFGGETRPERMNAMSPKK